MIKLNEVTSFITAHFKDGSNILTINFKKAFDLWYANLQGKNLKYYYAVDKDENISKNYPISKN